MNRSEYEYSACEELLVTVSVEVRLKSRLGIYCVKYAEHGTMHFKDLSKAQAFVAKWNARQDVKLY